MDINTFERLESAILRIIESVGGAKVEWIAEELDITKEEAFELLEALRHREDLETDDNQEWYYLSASRER